MFKNWKTTLIGVVAAVAHLSVNGMNLKQFLVALTVAALGAAAKDHNAQ